MPGTAESGEVPICKAPICLIRPEASGRSKHSGSAKRGRPVPRGPEDNGEGCYPAARAASSCMDLIFMSWLR